VTPKEFQAEVDRLAKMAVDAGKLIELGFLSYRKYVLGKDSTDAQVKAARTAFFTGAQHLYGSIMGVLEEGTEPTDKDMARMALIDKELREFYEHMQDLLKKGMH
jgi:hypothetical protein